MTHDELDRILSHKDEIVPSSGFVGSVMQAVREQASAPAPIPFPWLRALPGMIAAAIAVAVVVALFVFELVRPSEPPAIPLQALASELSRSVVAVAAALVLTLASTIFAKHFTTS